MSNSAPNKQECYIYTIRNMWIEYFEREFLMFNRVIDCDTLIESYTTITR